MKYWFFLSYAREDRDPYLERFCTDLSQAVRRLKGLTETTVGFFDTREIEPGERWPDALSEALQTSRVFIALYSPTYFIKEYCGKEWQVFQWRLDAYARQTKKKAPPLIIPLLWLRSERLPKVLPPAVSDVQYNHDLFGNVYVEEGLRQLLALKKHQDNYLEFVENFANRLVNAGESHDLPQLNDLQPLKEIPSVFPANPDSQQILPVRQLKDNVGPRYVQFIFVAGRRDELKAIRNKVEYYGTEGGLDWVPYLPDVPKEIGILAQDVAVEMDLRYEAIPLDEEFIKRLQIAELQNKMVVIIVDTWTLRLHQYHTFMRHYDERNFLNCVVLITSNLKDDETITSREALEHAVRVTFLNRTTLRDPNTFLDSITSPQQMKKDLSAALNKARMRIIEKADVIRKAESDNIIAKPIILGPGRSGI